MLRVDLRHAYPGVTLEVAFDAPAGVTALFGPSGAGKTTVAQAVAGLLRPDRGVVAVGGVTLTDTVRGLHVPSHRRRIGYVFQDARLFPHMTVRGNLAYGQRGGAGTFDRVVDLLDIAPLLPRGTAGLSGGEAARVAIGRALLTDPRLLVMDEPLANLDAARRAEILPYLERLRDQAGLPILYVSHDAAEVARLATTLVMIEGGRVRRAGPAAGIFADPALMPLFGQRGAGALVTGRIVAHHADGLTEVSVAAGTLWLPRVEAVPGAVLRLRIPAQDVILSCARPEGLSALNVLPARVTGLSPDAAGVTVALDAGGDALLARITARSAAALGVEPGSACFAILKSVALAQGPG